MRLLLLAAFLAPAALAQEGAMTHVLDHRFAPSALNMTEGGTLVVMSFGPSDHSLTADDGAFDVELPAPPPREWTERSLVPPQGIHPFHCRYHENMTGLLRVAPAVPAAASDDVPGFAALAGLAALSVVAAAWRPRARG